MNLHVVLQDEDIATLGNAIEFIPSGEDETETVAQPSVETHAVIYTAAQQSYDSDFQNQVLYKLDTLVDLGIYVMTFFLFVVVVLLIRVAYKFIRIFI